MCSIYILYSKEIDKYYIGYTCSAIDDRISKHNCNHKGFTGRVHDWKLVYLENFDDKQSAYRREREVKKWKSRKKIEALIKSK